MQVKVTPITQKYRDGHDKVKWGKGMGAKFGGKNGKKRGK